jgi:hypothetical protein
MVADPIVSPSANPFTVPVNTGFSVFAGRSVIFATYVSVRGVISPTLPLAVSGRR